MISFDYIINLWNIFFFQPEQASTIGLVRILLGLIFLVETVRFWDKSEWYFGDNGFYQTKYFMHSAYSTRLTIFKYIPCTNFYIKTGLVLSILASICVMIGFYTRLSCVIAFILRASFHNRNLYLFNSGDTLLRILTFLLIFSRAGDALSVDCYLSGKDMLNTMGPPWCERLMMIQVCTVYAYTAWLKICSQSWVDGSASYYPLQLYRYANCYVPKILHKTPWVQIATWLTLLIEEMVAFAIWIRELRYPTIFCGIVLHAVFAYCLKLEIFSYIMIVSLLLFLKPEDVSKWITELCGML